jgi:hypothetical protein
MEGTRLPGHPSAPTRFLPEPYRHGRWMLSTGTCRSTRSAKRRRTPPGVDSHSFDCRACIGTCAGPTSGPIADGEDQPEQARTTLASASCLRGAFCLTPERECGISPRSYPAEPPRDSQ